MINKFQESERQFIPNNSIQISTLNMEKFILNNFNVPDDNLSKICKFICSDSQIEEIIYALPCLINTEFPNDKLQIRFYDDFQEQELMLEIGIFTSFDMDLSLEKEEKLERKLFELYKHSADTLLLVVEF